MIKEGEIPANDEIHATLVLHENGGAQKSGKMGNSGTKFNSLKWRIKQPVVGSKGSLDMGCNITRSKSTINKVNRGKSPLVLSQDIPMTCSDKTIGPKVAKGIFGNILEVGSSLKVQKDGTTSIFRRTMKPKKKSINEVLLKDIFGGVKKVSGLVRKKTSNTVSNSSLILQSLDLVKILEVQFLWKVLFLSQRTSKLTHLMEEMLLGIKMI